MKRSDLVAETAISLLAERGMRGLTHRAVDEAAGLPPGSTSNLARTRAALLELTLSRLTDLEEQALSMVLVPGPPGRPSESPPGDSPEGPAETGVAPLGDLPGRLAEALHVQLRDRRCTLARYELALEATRRPELRTIYDRAGRRFRDPAVALLAAAGSRDPVRHARQLVAYGEGIMFDAIAGAGAEPSLDELRAAIRELLAGMLA
ncbi:TetR/AcrR family transcriptional regulator [Nonomuraea sp. NPDC048916]|uniref:TetR/AcrR family transcriptional regulator n=1 Tax=Nonomuraea sp. NPDC048916 TaxID=3154232 RepID=UPI00340A74DF